MQRDLFLKLKIAKKSTLGYVMFVMNRPFCIMGVSSHVTALECGPYVYI